MASSMNVTHDVHSLISSPGREFLLRNHIEQIPIYELEGKIIGLYFWATSYKSCRDFTTKLKEVYEIIKTTWMNLELVLVSLDDDEESFRKELESVHWLSLPIKDEACEKLVRYFELSVLPTLIIVAQDGKTLHPNVAEAIEGYGIDAYDLFTYEHFSNHDEMGNANEEAQTLGSILVSGERQ